jgi:hypothetical protein
MLVAAHQCHITKQAPTDRRSRATIVANAQAYFAWRKTWRRKFIFFASPRPLIDAVLCRGIRLRQIR